MKHLKRALHLLAALIVAGLFPSTALLQASGHEIMRRVLDTIFGHRAGKGR